MSVPEPTADALRDTFPACDDAPLALALLRLLTRGNPVTEAMLAAAAERTMHDVAAQLTRWPNIERDADAARTWQATHPEGHVLDLAAAFELGCRATAPLTAASTAQECC
jgi:hypothetical protein